MSLLSELIAQLRALIDHNTDTMTSVRSARDVVETTTTALQMALSDSSHSAAHEGLAQWQTAFEKLDEAQTLLLAGNAAMNSYITGPLLGGGTGPGRNAGTKGVNRSQRPTKSHGAQQKRAGVKSGPVRFGVPRKLEGQVTAMHKDEVLEYITAANKALADGQLSKTGRVQPSKDDDLKAEKIAAARRERLRAEKAGVPYGDKVAAHLPDTTWTGTADPPGGWGRHEDAINASLGSQSDKYPVGYKPTVFELDETWDTIATEPEQP